MNVAPGPAHPEQIRPRQIAVAILLVAGVWAATWSGAGVSSASRTVILISAAVCILALLITSRFRSIPLALVGIGLLSPALAIVAALNAYGQVPASSGGWRSVADVIPFIPSAADASLAWERVRTLVACLALAAVAGSVCRANDLRRIVVAGLGLLGVSVALYVLAQRFGLLPALYPNSEGPGYGPLRYHAHASALLAASVPLAVIAVRHVGLVSQLIVAGVICSAAVVTGSRLGVAVTTAAAIGSIAVLSRFSTASRPRLLAGLTIIAASVALAVTAMMVTTRDATVLGRGVGNARLIVWDLALRAAAERPIFGHGPGSFGILLHRLTPQERPDLYRNWIVRPPVPAGSDLSQWDVACNDLLQSLSELGLVGTALSLVTPAIALSRTWHATTPRSGDDRATLPPDLTTRTTSGPPLLASAVLLSLAALGAHALADWPLHLPGLAAIAFVLVGIGWSFPPSRSNEAHP